MKTNLRKLKIATLFLLLALPAGWVVTVTGGAGGAQSAKQPEQATEGQLHELLKARYDVATRLLEIEEKRVANGKSTMMNLYEASCRLRDSAIELSSKPEEQLEALRNHLAVTRRLEESVNKAVETGVAPVLDKDFARYLRLDAEIALLRAKRQATRAH